MSIGNVYYEFSLVFFFFFFFVHFNRFLCPNTTKSFFWNTSPRQTIRTKINFSFVIIRVFVRLTNNSSIRQLREKPFSTFQTRLYGKTFFVSRAKQCKYFVFWIRRFQGVRIKHRRAYDTVLSVHGAFDFTIFFFFYFYVYWQCPNRVNISRPKDAKMNFHGKRILLHTRVGEHSKIRQYRPNHSARIYAVNNRNTFYCFLVACQLIS